MWLGALDEEAVFESVRKTKRGVVHEYNRRMGDLRGNIHPHP